MAEHNNSPPQDETAADAASTLAAGNGVPNSQSGVSGSAADSSRKRPRPSTGDDDDDDEDSKPGRERRKIEIKFIQDKSRRHITFSKRKAGIMKKVRRLPIVTNLLLGIPFVGCRACAVGMRVSVRWTDACLEPPPNRRTSCRFSLELKCFCS